MKDEQVSLAINGLTHAVMFFGMQLAVLPYRWRVASALTIEEARKRDDDLTQAYADDLKRIQQE